jgi:hypothetical protein
MVTPLSPPPHAHARNTQNVVRDHVIFTDEDGMVNVTGGKWTTYRNMAEEAVDAAVATGRLPQNASKCRTRRMKLVGAERYSATSPAELCQQVRVCVVLGGVDCIGFTGGRPTALGLLGPRAAGPPRIWCAPVVAHRLAHARARTHTTHTHTHTHEHTRAHTSTHTHTRTHTHTCARSSRRSRCPGAAPHPTWPTTLRRRTATARARWSRSVKKAGL